LKIALGSDHAGFQLKKTIAAYLGSSGLVYEDFGVFTENSADYPDIAALVAGAVKSDQCNCGILICGTGIGMSIAANKYKGIRAALCGDTFSARYAREHNNANILTMGSRVIGSGLALAIVETYLKSSFEGGRHCRRIEKITLAEGLEN
jgi:ribose 5-phosphate isomerase B